MDIIYVLLMFIGMIYLLVPAYSNFKEGKSFLFVELDTKLNHASSI